MNFGGRNLENKKKITIQKVDKSNTFDDWRPNICLKRGSTT
jgi:hypothetical protein